jgi:hypothetical protein
MPSGTVGRRYARADELGVPFALTVDFISLLTECVTLRDRDSMAQVQVPLARAVSLVQELVAESVDWALLMTRFTVVRAGGSMEEEEGEAVGASAARTVVKRAARASFSRPNRPNPAAA